MGRRFFGLWLSGAFWLGLLGWWGVRVGSWRAFSHFQHTRTHTHARVCGPAQLSPSTPAGAHTHGARECVPGRNRGRGGGRVWMSVEGGPTASPQVDGPTQVPPSSVSAMTPPPPLPPAPKPDPPVTVRRGYSDFRSDTVTRPTPQMRKAMSKAEVGDDVYREDPTVDQLEREIAALMGHEAALFLPSRTMGNLIALLVWCSERGSSFICGEKSHVFLCEEGGAAQFGGVSPFPVPNEVDGTLNLENIERAIQEDQDARTAKVITIENPADRCGGRVLPEGYIENVAVLARQHELKLHLDGSRIWNAAVARGCEVIDIARHADSVTVCVSKGLGAPAGSLLVGSKMFIAKARKLRKALGGAMRQVGVLAAAGLVALRRTLPRLRDDHENAKRLAVLCAGVPGLKVDVEGVETNIVLADLDERVNMTSSGLVQELEKRGVLALAVGPRRVRFVTHYEVTDADVKRAGVALDKILRPIVEAQVMTAATAAPPNTPTHPPTHTCAPLSSTPSAAVHTHTQPPADQPTPPPPPPVDGQPLPPPPHTPPHTHAHTHAHSDGGDVSVWGPAPTVFDTTATTVTAPPPPMATDSDGIGVHSAGFQTGNGGGGGVPTGGGGGEKQQPAGEEKTEDVVVLGVSTSDEGFVVVLAQQDPEPNHPTKALKVLVTPTDPMSAGLDVHQAETPEAVTILQLLQDIDVGSHLRHDTLASIMGVKSAQQVSLKRVVIEQLNSGNRKFRARLEVDMGDHMNGTARQAQAAAAAYTNETVGGMPSAAAAAVERPKLVTAEAKSPFQALALALRYSKTARIAVCSQLFNEPNLVKDLADIRANLPDFLEIRPGKQTPTVSFDLDAAYEIGRLEKQLQAAIEEGNEAAKQRIQRQLSLYTTIDVPESVPLLTSDNTPPPPPQPPTHQQQQPQQQPSQPQPQPQPPAPTEPPVPQPRATVSV